MNNIKSQHNLDESLSALVDGEVSDLELRQILKALDDDNGSYNHLRGKWKSAHQAGSIIRSDDMRFANMDVSAQISMALQNETVGATATKTKRQVASWKEIWGKTGIAAAVALGVLFTFQIAQDDTLPASHVADNMPAQDTTLQVQPDAPQWFKQAPLSTRAASVAGDSSSTLSRSVFENHQDIDLNSDEQLQLRLQQILKEHSQNKKVSP